MKNLLLLLLLVCLPLIGFGQEGVQEKFYYENGQLKAVGSFKSSNQDGLWKFYYENGSLSEEGNFNNDEQVGLWKGYYENGYIHWQKEHVFFGGTLDYTKTVSYYENGEIKRKIKLCCFAIVTQLARPPAQKDGRSLVVSRNYRGHIVLK